MTEKPEVTIDDSSFPESLKREWEALSCLSWNEYGSTWLCRRKDDGEQAIFRIADHPEAVLRLKNEEMILRKADRSDAPAARLFPRPIDLKELTDPPHLLALIRSWIPGQSLEELVEASAGHPGLSRERAIRYTLEVLEQLDFLHHLRPPVIHRDVKPQNVIVDRENRCHLIDLDIARVQRKAGDTDTLIIGTRLTSPPEQFGYCPTDARSDIYSAGILLRYCLTGRYEGGADASLPPDLKAIVQTATRFDPESRYRQAAEFMDDLRAALPDARPDRRRGKHAAAAVLLILLLFGAFLAGRFSVRLIQPSLSSPVTGAESSSAPLITKEMFGGDESLYTEFMRGECSECAAVIGPDGMRFVRYLPFIGQIGERNPGSSDSRPLSSDELSAYLTALRKSPCWRSSVIMTFVDLEIESLEPFRRIKYIGDHYCLEFRNCRLPADPSPLKAAVPYLSDLACYNGTSVSWDNLDFLRTDNHMNILVLDFDGSTEVDLSALEELESPKTLFLANASIDDAMLRIIGRMQRLEILCLPNCGITDITPLAELANLTDMAQRAGYDRDSAKKQIWSTYKAGGITAARDYVSSIISTETQVYDI